MALAGQLDVFAAEGAYETTTQPLFKVAKFLHHTCIYFPQNAKLMFSMPQRHIKLDHNQEQSTCDI